MVDRQNLSGRAVKMMSEEEGAAFMADLRASATLERRRAALAKRIIAMDDTALSAMERCAGMIEGMH